APVSRRHQRGGVADPLRSHRIRQQGGSPGREPLRDYRLGERTAGGAGPPGPVGRRPTGAHSPRELKHSRKASMTITRIGITDPGNGMPVMSRVVVRGDTVYLCGVVPDPAGDIATQTRQVLEKIDQMLAGAGSDKSK